MAERRTRLINAQKLRHEAVKYFLEGWYLIPHSRWRSQVSTMKSGMYYKQKTQLYLLLLYSPTYYIYWYTYCCVYVPTVPTAVPTARARTIIPTSVQHVLPGTYSCNAGVRTYTFWKRRQCCRVDALHVPTDDARTYIEEKKKAALGKHLLHILLFLLMYVLLTIAISTHLPHQIDVPTVVPTAVRIADEWIHITHTAIRTS